MIKVVAYAVVVSCLYSHTHNRRSLPWSKYTSADCSRELHCSHPSSHLSKPVR